MSAKKTLDAEYFETLYAENSDPWNFETSAYEDAKYTATIDALGGRQFNRTLEVGCSIGVLTRRLTEVTHDLVAVDISTKALAAAATRNLDRSNVTFLRMALPSDVPHGPFDLIVLSEVLYYLNGPDLGSATEALLNQLAAGGDVLLVHWLGETGYPLTGDEATEGFITQAGPRLTIIQQMRHEAYRLDHLRRTA